MRYSRTSMMLRSFLVIVLFLVLTLIVFGDVVFSSGIVFGKDIIEQGYTLASFKYRAISAGEPPIWNPYAMCGFPQMSSAPFYPLDYVGSLLSTTKAVSLRYFFHTFIAGVLMFFLLRRFKQEIAPSILGALAFMFSGFFVSKVYAGHGGAFSSGVWLPLSFLCLDRALETRRLRDALLFGAAVGLQMLGEHMQYVFYSFIALAPYAIFKLWPDYIRSREWKSLVRYGVLAAAAVLFAITTSAVFFLPFRELTAMSNRAGGTSFAYATSLSLPPMGLLTAVYPNIWGSPTSHNTVYGALYWDGALYVGLIPLIFALVAVRWCPDRTAKYFKWLALVTVILALGSYTPIYKLAYHIPGFAMVRAPSKMLFIYSFAVAVLSAFGLNLLVSRIGHLRTESAWRLLSPQGRQIYNFLRKSAIVLGAGLVFFLIARPIILIIGKAVIARTRENPEMYLPKLGSLYITQLTSVALAAFFAVSTSIIVGKMLRRRIPANTGAALLVGLSFLDLMIYASPLVEPVDIDRYYGFNKGEVRFLQKDNDIFRILPVEDSTFRFLQGIVTGIESVNGYYPIIARRYGKLSQAIDGEKGDLDVSVEISNPNSKLLNLLNVKYVLSRKKLSSPDLVLVRPGPIKIYKNTNYLPRAFLVRQVKVARDSDVALNLVTASRFDPKKTLILEDKQKSLAPAPENARESVKIVRRTITRLAVSVAAASPAYLFVSDQYDPRWKAYVDDKPAEILQANYAFRAVKVPAGKHIVTMVHKPASHRMGYMLTSVSYLIILVMLISLWVGSFTAGSRQDAREQSQQAEEPSMPCHSDRS